MDDRVIMDVYDVVYIYIRAKSSQPRAQADPSEFYVALARLRHGSERKCTPPDELQSYVNKAKCSQR